MSKVKQALVAVKIIIVIVACVLGYMFYQNYSLSQQKREELQKINKLYNDSKWSEAVTGYKEYIKKYPEKKLEVKSRLGVSLQNMANDESIKAMGIPKKEAGRKKEAYSNVIKLLEAAKEFDNLTEMSYIILCDSCIECDDYNKAKMVIAEAQTKCNISPARFTVQQKRIDQAAKKK